MFYPSDPDQLRQMVRGFLGQVEGRRSIAPKALIVPHAGYIYSGAIAATAYARLQPEGIERVVLVGPSHHVRFFGVAAPESIAWQTPIGILPIDLEALERVSHFPKTVFSEKAHEHEHCLEVQLPFFSEVFGSVKLAPFVTCNTTPEEVSEVLNELWGGPETLVVISSDLSHYESYSQAVEKDHATAQAIVELNVRGLDSDHACGFTAISGLVHTARQRDMRVELLDLRNSGDTAGSRDQVVGYGAFALYE